MNFDSVSDVTARAFVGGLTVSELQASCAMVPKVQGTYLIAREKPKGVCFLEQSVGGHFKGRDPTVSLEKLQSRWIAASKVLYIGKAGASDQSTTLQGRLHSYMQFGLGKPCAHWGGRYIWQLSDAKNLLVFWKKTPDVEPTSTESALLTEFKGIYGQLPFANLRR